MLDTSASNKHITYISQKEFLRTQRRIRFLQLHVTNIGYMDTKLTLRLDDSVIERAKVYARNHKVSLSKMIETYLDSLTTQKHQAKNIIITPLVESLSGVIDAPEDLDYKNEYRDYLEKKYQ